MSIQYKRPTFQKKKKKQQEGDIWKSKDMEP